MKAVIVDDEIGARELLCDLIGEYFEDLEVVGMAKSALEGLKLFKSANPILFF